jgi:hypothetical protein
LRIKSIDGERIASGGSFSSSSEKRRNRRFDDDDDEQQQQQQLLRAVSETFFAGPGKTGTGERKSGEEEEREKRREGEEGGEFVSSAERDSSREQRRCLLHFCFFFLFFSPGNMASEEAKLGKLLTRRACRAREVERNRRGWIRTGSTFLGEVRCVVVFASSCTRGASRTRIGEKEEAGDVRGVRGGIGELRADAGRERGDDV